MILVIGEYKLRVAQCILNVFVQLYGHFEYLFSENVKKRGSFYSQTSCSKSDKFKR